MKTDLKTQTLKAKDVKLGSELVLPENTFRYKVKSIQVSFELESGVVVCFDQNDSVTVVEK